MCVCVYVELCAHEGSTHAGQKRVPDPPESGVRGSSGLTVMSAGNLTRVFGKTSKCS